MEDGIIKGTGNSRFLKSVANAKTLYPTHETLMEALVAGTFPIDLNGLNPAGWENEGTKLGKATLLDDATAKMLGDIKTPNEALAALKSMVDSAKSTAESRLRIATGSYTGNGTVGKDNAVTLTFSFQPKVVFIQSKTFDAGYSYSEISRNAGCTTLFYPSPFADTSVNRSGGYTTLIYVEWNGNSVSWYSGAGNAPETGIAAQMNASRQYYYAAIG